MRKSIMLFAFFIIIFLYCFAFNDLFPNEVLYQSRPAAGVRYTDGTVDFFVNTRFSVDTVFNYKVYEPLLAGIIQTESSFYIHAISDSNALGLFQMKPFIASEIGVLNPFNPQNDKEVSSLINKYTTAFGNVDYALGAYHIGYYGVQKMLDSGNNPMSDNRINEYVKKIHSFQRLYKEGDRIPLKDYVWLDCSISLSQLNEFSGYLIFPEFYLGSIALGVSKEDAFRISLYQDFSFFWFLNTYIGYDDGLIMGLTLRSNDWYDKVSVRYDFSEEDLIWTASFSFDFFSVDFGFSKTSISIKPAFVLNDRYFFEIPLFYSDHSLIPGVSAIIKF